jgi:hypothetical protein
LYPITVLLLISAIWTSPAPAADPTDVIQTGAPVIPKLIGRILEDPYRDYDSVKGPDDCSSESLYNDSREMLGKYAADPAANGEALREYIISGEAQCNCTAAIVRKEFDILLDHLEADISKVPCL